MSTAEDPANPVGEFVSAEQPLGLNYLTFSMTPLRLDGIEPWAFGRQQTRCYPDPMAAGFDLAVTNLSQVSSSKPTAPSVDGFRRGG